MNYKAGLFFGRFSKNSRAKIAKLKASFKENSSKIVKTLSNFLPKPKKLARKLKVSEDQATPDPGQNGQKSLT